MDWTATLPLSIPLAALGLPILGLMGILGFALALRHTRPEATAMLPEQGATVAAGGRQRVARPSRTALFLGIVITMMGLGLSVALYPIGILTGSTYPLAMGPWMILGLLPLLIGAGLILWHFLGAKGR